MDWVLGLSMEDRVLFATALVVTMVVAAFLVKNAVKILALVLALGGVGGIAYVLFSPDRIRAVVDGALAILLKILGG